MPLTQALELMRYATFAIVLTVASIRLFSRSAVK